MTAASGDPNGPVLPIAFVHGFIIGGGLKTITVDVDITSMSDLSNLLGDVYGDHGEDRTEPAANGTPSAQRLPEWSEDARLDRAFADWEPEARYPLNDAPAPGNNGDLAAALSAALAEEVARPATPAAPMAPAAPVAAPAPPAPVAPPAPAMTPRASAFTPAPSVMRAPAAAPAPVVAPPAPAPRPTPAPAAPPTPAPAVASPSVVVTAPVATRSWAPGDDDIFPTAKGGKKSKR